MAAESLAQFIDTHREELLRRCRAKVAGRSEPAPTQPELERGIPRFLDDIVSELIEGPSLSAAMRERAARHGKDLYFEGCTVAQVVQDYGSVCQSITDLAVESAASITAEDFRTLNRCLDDSIANAVSEYSRQEGYVAADRTLTKEIDLRNLLQTAITAYEVLQTGAIGIGGATGKLLGQSLTAMRVLLAR